MKINLTETQFDFLNKHYFNDRNISSPTVLKHKNLVSIDLLDDTADEIRDWALEEMQKVGFDRNYDLTHKGKILEELATIFYV